MKRWLSDELVLAFPSLFVSTRIFLLDPLPSSIISSAILCLSFYTPLPNILSIHRIHPLISVHHKFDRFCVVNLNICHVTGTRIYTIEKARSSTAWRLVWPVNALCLVLSRQLDHYMYSCYNLCSIVCVPFSYLQLSTSIQLVHCFTLLLIYIIMVGRGRCQLLCVHLVLVSCSSELLSS